MTTSSNFPSRFHADFPLPGVKLTQFQARVWGWLRSRAHLPQGICQAAETLSRIFGCSRRYVERTLKFFQDLGVLRRVVDYGLRTRRRLFVVAPSGESPLPAPAEASLVPPPETNFLGALECAQPAHWSAPTDGLPPDPPIEVSGDISEGSGSGGGRTEETPPPPEVDLIPLDLNPTDQSAMADPDQVEAMVAQAAEVYPTRPRGWVLALARTWSLRWVRAALGRAKAKRAVDGTVGTGYAIRVLEGFHADGGPPLELADPEQAETARRAQIEHILATMFTEEALAGIP